MDALLKKMKFVGEQPIAVIGAPRGFVVTELLHAAGHPVDEVLQGKYKWFVLCVMQSAEVGAAVPRAMQHLADDGMLWICYPKKSGKIKTDLSRDHGWEAITGIGLRHLNLISVDPDWSAWCVGLGSDEVAEKTQQKSDARNALLAQYMNHETREMTYPPDMTAALDKRPELKAFFLQQSFTNRKEYLEWIVSAKRPETLEQRLAKMLDYLQEGRKNPAGR